MSDHYILDADKRPVCVGVEEWERWFDMANRHVAFTQINSQVEVSTLFLGIDHSFGRPGPPILFETMIFGGEHDQDRWRYSSWDEAKAGHDAVVKRLKGDES